MSLYGVENVCKHREGSGGDPVSQTKAMRFRIWTQLWPVSGQDTGHDENKREIEILRESVCEKEARTQ